MLKLIPAVFFTGVASGALVAGCKNLMAVRALTSVAMTFEFRELWRERWVVDSKIASDQNPFRAFLQLHCPGPLNVGSPHPPVIDNSADGRYTQRPRCSRRDRAEFINTAAATGGRDCRAGAFYHFQV